jgi:hypothetical protein
LPPSPGRVATYARIGDALCAHAEAGSASKGSVKRSDVL